MDYYQIYINIGGSIIVALMGLIVHGLWDSLKELKETDKKLAEKVGDIEVLVAGSYVEKTAFMTSMQNMGLKLDDILKKLDTKTAKEDCHFIHSINKGEK